MKIEKLTDEEMRYVQRWEQ